MVVRVHCISGIVESAIQPCGSQQQDEFIINEYHRISPIGIISIKSGLLELERFHPQEVASGEIGKDEAEVGKLGRESVTLASQSGIVMYSMDPRDNRENYAD